MPALTDFSPIAQQLISLTVCFILCSLLGVERQFHHKNAGVKTHVLVGVGSCLFTLISAYGFASITTASVAVDPSRIAAQIVSGIGFIGAGVIFVNNDAVRGLTTAATVWVSAALGMACGAGLFHLAVYALLLHYLVVFIIGPLMNLIPHSNRNLRTVVEYEAGQGAMRQILSVATNHGYKASVTSTSPIEIEEGDGMRVVLKFEGPHPQTALINAIAEIPQVHAVDQVDRNELD
ncbi:Mg2+ transporter-C family protein [Gleimia coleocanis DSM 15436]|uniref:Mg2+ transporter-C family protein n=1 Tax=Gleimia coleocanis DSM 15436 TaxID=525245 RepID=C0W0S5_9ACTO|nr:MgtC/SapB family protein [Gleimia coleocanis]EEH63649.1 Mg2+ transporter-C family protein [Gleimia coleocanis DSM 15436]